MKKRDLFSPKDEEEKAKLERKAEVEEMAKTFMVPAIKELFLGTARPTRAERDAGKDELKAQLIAHLTEQGVEEGDLGYGTSLIYDFLQMEISKYILESDTRIDGRGLEDVRSLIIETDLIPRVHGSGHFMRGETQALSIATLGAPGDKQTLDGMEITGEKRYMHHYNFPPYSVGEAKPLRGAGRREIGHGALAEKALEPVLPALEDFLYTIRVVSETMNSNGSSSMASTCGSTLALLHAGVPLKAPVAGIAMV